MEGFWGDLLGECLTLWRISGGYSQEMMWVTFLYKLFLLFHQLFCYFQKKRFFSEFKIVTTKLRH